MTPLWPHHITLVTAQRQPYGFATGSPQALHARLLFARKARNFPVERLSYSRIRASYTHFLQRDQPVVTRLLRNWACKLNFRITKKCAKSKKNFEKGVLSVFWGLQEQDNHAFCTFFKTIVTGTETFKILYLIDIQLFRQITNGRYYNYSYYSLLFLRVFISLYLYITICILDIYIKIRKSVNHIF